MDRQIVYPGQILPETTLLQMAKDSMIGSAKLAAAILGTSTLANGFAVTPTGPASLQIVVAPGEIYSLANIDSLAFSTLPADTTHSILKQGILLDGLTLSCPAPTTTGQSINYLVQVTYQDQDSTPVLLPYYNSANPALPYSGMGNNGLTQNTVRKGVAIVQVKAGASAATGSQVTPSPDAGYIGLYVVTVAYGQTTITSGSIAQVASAPLINTTLHGLSPSFSAPLSVVPATAASHAVNAGQIQGQTLTAFTSAGTAPSFTLAPTPAITTYSGSPRFQVTFNAASGATPTLNISGLGAKNLKQYNGSGTKIAATFTAGQIADVVYDGTDLVMIDQLPVDVSGFAPLNSPTFTGTPGTNSTPPLHDNSARLANTNFVYQELISLSLSVVGTVRNLKMSVSAASATATLTADEIIVATALGGAQAKLSSFSKTINLATTGAGGMDTGTAPVSGYVAIYAIYNPTTATSALLAVNATSAVAPTIYGGANMPSGYTYSALVSVRATNASSQFKISYQFDRTISFPPVSVLSSTAAAASLTSLSIAAAVPFNATSAFGPGGMNSNSGALNLNIASDANNSCVQQITAAAVTNVSANFNVPIVTPQTVYYTFTATGTSASVGISIGGYTI